MNATIKAAIQALKSRIADAYTAIQTKGGTLPATQDSANLPAAIASIPSGGGEEPEEKDVLFIDYDGTIIASYTYEEFESVTDYPTPPTHEGLTFIKWTNTLQELKDNPKKITLCGAMYQPADEKVHIFIYVPRDGEQFVFGVYGTPDSVDWGDGAIDTNLSHTYQNRGYYEIKITHSANIIRFNILDKNSKQMLRGIWCYNTDSSSTYASIGTNDALIDCANLEWIVAPPEYNLLSDIDTLNGCASLKAIVTKRVGGSHRALRATGIKYLTGYFDTAPINYLENSERLRRINFPIEPTSTYAQTNKFSNFRCIQYIWLNPNAGVESMQNCISAREIHIPHASVPSLPNTNYFSNVPTTCKIYVKTGLLSQYETATNWSTIYSQYQFIEED